jgi:hypothetical protein
MAGGSFVKRNGLRNMGKRAVDPSGVKYKRFLVDSRPKPLKHFALPTYTYPFLFFSLSRD